MKYITVSYRQKIDEAPTPFRYLSESDQSEAESGSDGEFLLKAASTEKYGQTILYDSWEEINAKLHYEKHLRGNEAALDNSFTLDIRICIMKLKVLVGILAIVIGVMVVMFSGPLENNSSPDNGSKKTDIKTKPAVVTEKQPPSKDIKRHGVPFDADAITNPKTLEDDGAELLYSAISLLENQKDNLEQKMLYLMLELTPQICY